MIAMANPPKRGRPNRRWAWKSIRPRSQLTPAQQLLWAIKERMGLLDAISAKITELQGMYAEVRCETRNLVHWIYNPKPDDLPFDGVCALAGIDAEMAMDEIFAGLSDGTVKTLMDGTQTCPCCGRKH